MTENETLEYILDRLGYSQDQQAIFGVDEVDNWFPGIIKNLIKNGILQEVQPAKVIACPGCEEHCYKEVDILPAQNKQPARAFIACDKRDDIGRIHVDLSLLKQWQISGELLVKIFSKLLGLKEKPKSSSTKNQWTLGIYKGKKHNDYIVVSIENGVLLKLAGYEMPLIEVLTLKEKKLIVYQDELIKLVDNPIKLSIAKNPNSSVTRCEAKKLKTQDMYLSWQKEYKRQKKESPATFDTDIAKKIAKLNIANKHSHEYIRRYMKK